MRESVLVIKLGALGDIFLALESFQAIRAQHPGAEIILLTRPPFVSLAQSMPWFTAVWADPGIKFWQLPRAARFAGQLRRARFARVYDLQGNDRARFYRRLGGWPEPAVWVPASLTEKEVRRRGLPVMAVSERHRQMLAAAGVTPAGPPELSWLTAPLDGLAVPERFVLLIPGCAPTRRTNAGHRSVMLNWGGACGRKG
jgi:ADP-heptose:LPS heptosyltransferase